MVRSLSVAGVALVLATSVLSFVSACVAKASSKGPIIEALYKRATLIGHSMSPPLFIPYLQWYFKGRNAAMREPTGKK